MFNQALVHTDLLHVTDPVRKRAMLVRSYGSNRPPPLSLQDQDSLHPETSDTSDTIKLHPETENFMHFTQQDHLDRMEQFRQAAVLRGFKENKLRVLSSDADRMVGEYMRHKKLSQLPDTADAQQKRALLVDCYGGKAPAHLLKPPPISYLSLNG